jgi:DNA polymerase-3 subunit gamma/tau
MQTAQSPNPSVSHTVSPSSGNAPKNAVTTVAASYSSPITPAAIKPKQPDTPPVVPRIRTTSLKELGKEKEKLPVASFSSQMEDMNSAFSQEDLTRYWIEYANSLTIEKIHLKNTLISCKPALKENFSFEVSVYNPNQKDKILDNSTEILGHLCSKLNNTRIKMDIRIVEKNEKEMIYTSSERYAYLSKKNPNIEKLKDIFDLTIE